MPWRCFASRFSALPLLCEESHSCSVARPRNALPLLCSAICAIPMPSNSVHRFAVAMLCPAFPPQCSAPHCRYCAKERGAIPSRFNVRHIDSELFLCDSIQYRALPLPFLRSPSHYYALPPQYLCFAMHRNAVAVPSLPRSALPSLVDAKQCLSLPLPNKTAQRISVA